MNVRLVAYRPNIDGKETTYQLDLQESPNISINFQFSDVKNPETRKANYSQTFKLPFTDNNNEFFQNWFNVNLTTLIFSTKQKFNASLFVGTVPQFEGFIQLKAVYQKAQLYEVVLMSNAADLFTVIGSKSLKDVFKDDDGNYSDELNHIYSYENLGYCWDGSSTNFQNTSGVSLRDADAGVQKVMYPLSVTIPKFWYSALSNQYLDMSNTDISNYGDDAINYIVPITQFKPAIQIRTLLKLILARAGFSYTSTFIDTNYFGKLFMTTCNHTGVPSPVIIPTAGAVDGQCTVGNSEAFGNIIITADEQVACELGMTLYSQSGGDIYDPDRLLDYIEIPADTVSPISGDYTLPSDQYNLWNTNYNVFKKTDANMSSIKVRFKVQRTNIAGCWDYGIDFQFEVWTLNENLNTTSTEPDIYDYYTITDGFFDNSGDFEVERTFDISGVQVGHHVRIYTRPFHYKKPDAGSSANISLGYATYPNSGLYNEISVQWIGLNTNVFGQTVDVPGGIDSKITQKAFLKDLIERFNLVVIPDPNNSENLIIEPYNDYIASGDIKHWTEKLDLSKEIIVKDTSSLQKERVFLTDLEDVDVMNKSIKEELPEINVFGKIDMQNTENQFAQGEMKNTPIFSPYINQKVFAGNDEDAPTQLENVAVQYEYTYKENEDVLEATKPKIFFYNGTKTTVSGSGYYLHSQDAGTAQISAHGFTDYPLCSPYELNASSGTSTISLSTRSLYWSQQPPPAGDLTVFNSENGSILLANSLYFQYWEQYFNMLYNEQARIMECYLNLNEVDIFNFKFSDEIFIKDSYWRVLNISNYQVGSKASTKVTLIKVDEFYDVTCDDCDYVVGEINGVNIMQGIYLWCSSSDADCSPVITPGGQIIGVATQQECCDCVNGNFLPISNTLSNFNTWGAGLGICFANQGSLPIQLLNIYATRSIFNGGGLKNILSGKLNGLEKPLITGGYRNKYTSPILPYSGDDVVIKYNTYLSTTPKLDGESHRIVLMGYTEGNTRSYAYTQGDSRKPSIIMPINTNMIIRVKGIATVVGGTSSTYTLDTTEAFAYYTAFKNVNGVITQLSTAGGQQEFSIREGVLATTCTLYITTSNNVLQFGLDDSQTDTKRIWSLTVDLDVNQIYSMELGYDSDWAMYQNMRKIKLQNGDDLLWN